MTDLALLPAHELLARLRRREISAEDLLEHHLSRIARLNPALNAVVAMNIEPARARARDADQALARGQSWGPLHGLPMTIKEGFDLTGLPTTWGYTEHLNNIATRPAVAVQRLLDAGAVIFGKTNVAQSLADWQSFNRAYGTTNNPWDVSRGPGGSSGGSAAALAAGLSPLELGSDIASSIRNPAHYCGVYGHKPTWGVVPLEGQQLPGVECMDATDIGVAGPMARSATDLLLMMDILADPPQVFGPMGWTPTRWRDAGPAPQRCRIAVMYDDEQAQVDDTVQARLRELVTFLRDRGVAVTENVKPVDSAVAHKLFLLLLRSATGAWLDDAGFARSARIAAALPADDISYPAQQHRGQSLSHRDWVALDQQRFALRKQWAAFFERFDFLITPIATTAAFPHNQQGERWERMLEVNGRLQPGTDAMFWAGHSSVAGLPSTAFPLGLTPGGLPVGAQLVGPVLSDPACIRFTQWLEREWRGFVPPPMAVATGG